jgi:molecular chaperone DnaJ
VQIVGRCRGFVNPWTPSRPLGNNWNVAVLKRDYYDVLGVSRDADGEAIRHAFDALARDWHPDVAEGPDAEERFRELAEAYSVLSNREARLIYDRRDVVRGEDIHTEIEVRSFEAEAGTRRHISFDAVVRCTACMGRGSVALPDPGCRACHGSGKKVSTLHAYFPELQQFQPCQACLGEPCARCGGGGTVRAVRRARLRIPPGVEDGTQLRVSGDGNDAGTGSVPGDLLVLLRVVPGPKDPRAVRYLAFALLLVALALLVLYLVR